jgi:amino acid transporter
MVAGGPYGLEELVAASGFHKAIVILLFVPLIWSLPTALMVAELSSAIPEEGGYYAWVRRAMGPFWGFQEAWLSLSASIFDMAIYPTLFTLYLSRFFPSVASPGRTFALGFAMIAACTAWNLRGARSVGDSSIVMTILLLAPFAAISALALWRGSPASSGAAPHPHSWLVGILVAMWNYMGWDNASTVAGEVERPQVTYPKAILGAVFLVAATYVLPVAAAARGGIDPSAWTTGSWVDVARSLGGPILSGLVVAGGALCGIGIFNALVLSYSRIPAALADDGYLPRILSRRSPATGAPTVSILVCAVFWTACLTLGFDRLVELDVLLYGASLMLEFVALVRLRVREPGLRRPFRIPGGTAGAVAAGVGPAVLLAIALVQNRSERFGPVNALIFGTAVVLAGPILFLLRVRREGPAV